jgi:uncharacterized membrane protein YiaA
MNQKPSSAFIGASWVALGTGMIGYLIGLWRSDMHLNEKRLLFYGVDVRTFFRGIASKKCSRQA